jgi:hypothetical protein
MTQKNQRLYVTRNTKRKLLERGVLDVIPGDLVPVVSGGELLCFDKDPDPSNPTPLTFVTKTHVGRAVMYSVNPNTNLEVTQNMRVQGIETSGICKSYFKRDFGYRTIRRKLESAGKW